MQRSQVPLQDTLTLLQSKPEDIARIPNGVGKRMLFLMRMIHAFENRVIALKRDDCVWGPIHISIGQEAVAAATIAAIEEGDKIAGSHRAHHVFVAKALQHVLPVDWSPTEGQLPRSAQKVVDKTLAEIMGLSPGYCGGRGGSMHLRWIEGGILGTNAIVAGGVPLSAGAAMAEQYRGTDRVILCFLGDGAVNQGSFHEACNLAGLWNLPIIYVIENNQYAVATSAKDACAIENLAQHSLAYNMVGASAFGYDPIAMYEAIGTMAGEIRNGGRPGILELRCYRHYHHGGDLSGSAYGYRNKEEEAEWRSRDSLVTFPELLISAGRMSEDEVRAVEELAERSADEAVSFCAELVETVGEAETSADPSSGVVQPVYRVKEELWPDRTSVSMGVLSDGRELESLEYRERESYAEMQSVRYSDAIAAATGRWLELDPETVVFGEEVANFGGGAYGATKGLPAKYPDRVRNTPISENGFSGLGLGLAMSGMRPVIEIMFPDFTLVAADQIFNQIGKARHMFGGTTDLPLVLRTRIATGCGYGGQHSMDPIGLYALFPGWRIVAPSDSYDYIGLFNTAMHSLDPVVILEHHSVYEVATEIPKDDLDYCIPFGKARAVRNGGDITVLTYGSMTRRLQAIAEDLAGESGGARSGSANPVNPIDIELIDLRTLDLANVDFETIGESLGRTGQIAIFEQAAGGQSIGRRIMSEVTERFFDDLDGPPGVFTSLDVPNSVSRILEDEAMISDDQIAEAIRAMVSRRWK